MATTSSQVSTARRLSQLIAQNALSLRGWQNGAVIALIPGFFASLSLIVAIGAQNAFVIRQGLARNHIVLVVVVCAIADAVLIALGVAGLGALIQQAPVALEVVRWFGVAYLSYFGVKSVIAATKLSSMNSAGDEVQSAKKVLLSVLAFTLLNPHVYLDTVILLGSIGNQFGQDRWFFAAGAAAASILWFTTIGFGARSASRFMSKPIFWRVLDSVIAGVMFSIALLLAFLKF
ncbi:MAG: amino acid transporter [Phenylobacterium zucineum]|nr:MAG: amino acid transporter [Phenylobacterium zucineum]